MSLIFFISSLNGAVFSIFSGVPNDNIGDNEGDDIKDSSFPDGPLEELFFCSFTSFFS